MQDELDPRRARRRGARPVRRQRGRELVRTNAVSRASVDDALSAEGEAKAAVEARQAALAAAKSEIATVQVEIDRNAREVAVAAWSGILEP